MDGFLAVVQGIGLALAAGIGGLLVPLLGSSLAHLDAGWNLDGTSWEWLGDEWTIAAIFVANVAAFYLRDRDVARSLALAPLCAWGAVAFAASLAERGEPAWPGLIAGALLTLLAAVLARDVLEGATRRTTAASDEGVGEGVEGAGGLVLLAAAAGLVLCAVALLVPPLSLVALAALVIVAAGRRRRAGRKHEGLRVLR